MKARLQTTFRSYKKAPKHAIEFTTRPQVGDDVSTERGLFRIREIMHVVENGVAELVLVVE